MRVEPSIFKAYDIRGTYPAQINADVAYAIGRAFAALLAAEQHEGSTLRVAVGRDMRLSSPELTERLIAGLSESGVDVENIGLVSTPTFYFGVAHSGYDGGVQVSASHNPKEWNGFKLVRKNAKPVSGKNGILAMREMIENDTFPTAPDRPGTYRERNDILAAEIEEQISHAPSHGPERPLKIAIDPASAMGALDMHAFFENSPHQLIWLNDVLDGTFPAHPADPMVPENLAQLKKAVIENNCDLGIASDGDGDRYFFIDEKGNVLPQEIQRGIISQLELKKHPGATIVYDARPGRITKDMVEASGGKGVLAPVGHSLIKEIMLAEDSVFGAESSGHYFFKLPYGTFEAPLVLVSEFLEWLSAKKLSLSELVAPYKRYSNSGEINTRLADRDAGTAVIERIKKQYEDGQQSFIDGLSVEYPDYWFNVRLSNTEPLIRFIVEAKNEAMMAKERDRLLAMIMNS